MRLLDRILSLGIGLYDMNLVGLRDSIMPVLNDSQLVVIDNVADYFFSQRINDFFTASDFPCVMLPFERCFMEFRVPEAIIKKTGWDEVGVLMMMTENIDDLKHKYPKIYNLPGVMYDLWTYYFFRQLGYKQPILIAKTHMPVGIKGQIITPANGRIYGGVFLFQPGISEEAEKNNIQLVHQYMYFPALLGLSFMHCRNVSMKQETPPSKLIKARQKKKKRPLLRYYVLVIDHMKQVLESEGHASKEGLKKALHICRGHFATYGMNGKGLLFGKHAGRIWVPMHTRGSAKKGVVVKDYDVK